MTLYLMLSPALGAHWKGVRASIETTHGLIEVQKFLAVKGPSGTYSHACTSRADPLKKRKGRYCDLCGGLKVW